MTVTHGNLTYAHVEFFDDSWGWAIVNGYRNAQEYGHVYLKAETEDGEPLSKARATAIMKALAKEGGAS